MPRSLVLVLALFGALGLLDLAVAVGTDTMTTTTWVRLSLTGLLLVGLLMGKELARNAGIVISALGIFAAVWTGIQVARTVAAANAAGLSLGALPYVLGAVAVVHLAVFSTVMVCLRRHDVQAWMFARSHA